VVENAGGLILVALVGIWVFSSPTPALRDLEKTRSILHRDGFRVDLREFDFALSPELSWRAALLARTTRAELTNRLRPDPMLGSMQDFPQPLTIVGDQSFCEDA